MKLKFEEAISVPESERRSVADSIDFHLIGNFSYLRCSWLYHTLKPGQLDHSPLERIYPPHILVNYLFHPFNHFYKFC